MRKSDNSYARVIRKPSVSTGFVNSTPTSSMALVGVFNYCRQNDITVTLCIAVSYTSLYWSIFRDKNL